MIKIQTIADVHALKKQEKLPSFYIREIEDFFLLYYEAQNEGESLDAFCLPNNSCIYHLDSEEDKHMIIDNYLNVEYVDIEEVEGRRYFRIGLMHDHQMNMIYFLEGTLPKRVERWLAN